jgi:hypothetical protein
VTDVRVTAARVALMRAIDGGAVMHHRPMGSSPYSEVDLVDAGWPLGVTSRRRRRVTAEVNKLGLAGLVRLEPTMRTTADSWAFQRVSKWELTDAGRAWLNLRAERAADRV